MTLETTDQRLTALFEEMWGPEKAKAITDDEKLFMTHAAGRPVPEDALDSLDRADLLMAVEEQFDIELPDRIAALIETKKQLVDYIDNAVASKNAKNT